MCQAWSEALAQGRGTGGLGQCPRQAETGGCGLSSVCGENNFEGEDTAALAAPGPLPWSSSRWPSSGSPPSFSSRQDSRRPLSSRHQLDWGEASLPLHSERDPQEREGCSGKAGGAETPPSPTAHAPPTPVCSWGETVEVFETTQRLGLSFKGLGGCNHHGGPRLREV